MIRPAMERTATQIRRRAMMINGCLYRTGTRIRSAILTGAGTGENADAGNVDIALCERRLRRYSLLAFVITLPLCIALAVLTLHAHTLRERNHAASMAANHTALLQQRLGHSLSATYALAAAVREGSGEIKNFDALGSEMLRVFSGIQSVQLARGGVVSAVVPFVGNAAALGHDLFSDPARSAEALRARDSRSLTVAGPMRLRQGEHGLIGRLPVFLPTPDGHDYFWGFSTVVIRMNDLLTNSGLPQLAENGFHYQLAALEPQTGETRVFSRSGPDVLQAPLTHTFEVPNGKWALSVVPAAGWISAPLWIGAAVSCVLLAALAAGFTHMLLQRSLKLHRRIATQETNLAVLRQAINAEKKKNEAAQREIAGSISLYTLLNQMNTAIMHISEPARLLDELCRIAVCSGGFAAARAARLSRDDLSWQWEAAHGIEVGVPDCTLPAPYRLEDRSSRATLKVCGQIRHSAHRASPLCEHAAAAGVQAHVLLKLRQRGKLIGLFSLYANDLEFLDEARLRLFEELANNVSAALENREREQARHLADINVRKLSRAVEQSPNAILITDRAGVIEYVNPWFCRVTGYTPEEVLGRTPSLLRSAETHPETHKRMWETLLSGKEWTGELHNTKKNGDLYWCLETISPLKDEDGEITHFIAVTEDISERKESEQTIRHLAFHDPLTALPNRRLFNDRLRQAVVLRHRKGQGFALALLDIDRFKTINDTLGHDAGDALLKAIAARLSAHCRTGDTLARIGGDEFGLVAMGISHPEEAARMMEKLLRVLKEPFHLYGQDLYVAASIGVTLYPDDASEAEALIRNADTALYRAKDCGRNNFQFFTEDMNTATTNRLRLENAMRRAIERNEFMLHYQPQVDIATGAVHGAEALIRWRHPELGMVSPAQFIPLAEETGMIVDIGEWTLRTACAQAKAWQQAGAPIRVAVNLSARQFQQGDLAEVVLATLTEFDLPPELLEVELTEGILMGDTDQASSTLEKLHAMGVQIAIDDFGTGYSSLSYLKRMPIHILKIDQSFVRDIHRDPDDRAIVTAVIALAHSLKLKVIAEGVETVEQLAFLRQHQCDMMQGYLFSRPIPGSDLLTLQLSGTTLTA